MDGARVYYAKQNKSVKDSYVELKKKIKQMNMGVKKRRKPGNRLLTI